MSSSSFRINFCCSSTFEVSSAIFFSASSRRLDFSDILTFQEIQETYKTGPAEKITSKHEKYFDCPKNCLKPQTTFQHLTKYQPSVVLVHAPFCGSCQEAKLPACSFLHH
jgi:hypothetical protein